MCGQATCSMSMRMFVEGHPPGLLLVFYRLWDQIQSGMSVRVIQSQWGTLSWWCSRLLPVQVDTVWGRDFKFTIPDAPPLPHRRTVTSMNRRTKVRARCGRRRPGSSATENSRFTRRTTALYHSPTSILGCTKAGATTITRHTQSKIYTGRAALITCWNTTEFPAGRHVITRKRCKVYVIWHDYKTKM